MIGDKILTRKAKKSEKTVKRKKTAIRVAIVLVVFVVVSAVVISWLVSAPLKIRKIKYVTEDKEFSKQAQTVLSGYLGKDALPLLFKGGSVSAFLNGEVRLIEKEIEGAMPFYKNVSATIKPFEALEIYAEKRDSFIPFENGDGIVVADRDGFVVFIGDKSTYVEEFEATCDGEILPDFYVSGIQPTYCDLGKKIEFDASVSWKNIAEVYFTVVANSPISKKTEKIIITEGNLLYIYMQNGLKAHFGILGDNEETFDKLERLSLILSSDKYSFENGTIFLQTGENDIFRPDKAEDDSYIKIEIDH